MIKTATLLITIGLASLAQAKLNTAKVFSDHMVLQRGIPTPVWGWADPGKEVTVSFSGQEKKATSGPTGRWEIKLDVLQANATAQAMVITEKAGESITLNDILVGDVWICSGQSNMEWTVQQSFNAPQEIAQANHPLIRLFDVKGHEIAPSEAERLAHPTSWQVCSPQSIPAFSAVGYYFGREIQQQSGVPIGLLGTNWGGTRIEPWTPPVGFRMQPELADYSKLVDSQVSTTDAGKATWLNYLQDMNTWTTTSQARIKEGLTLPSQPLPPGPKHHGEPAAIYNAMVAPIVGYGVRGAIWYQGESNSGEGLAYLPKLKALVDGWRTIWKQPADFPFHFYVVKLAQFTGANDNPEGGDGFARVRVAQDRIQELPYTGVASTIDIGNAKDIHPKNKQDVGKRLALWALRDVYGKADTIVSGPTFKAMTVNGNKAIISYDHLGGGLMIGKKDGITPTTETPNAKLQRFAICGADKKWHWAEARIVGDTVEVSTAAVAQPVAVRYAYSGNPLGANLYNKAGLPAIPFRSDNWNP